MTLADRANAAVTDGAGVGSDGVYRAPATCACYRPDDPVWMRRKDSWRPGRVLFASTLAATVRYTQTDARGCVTDTVTAPDLTPREDPDGDTL